MLKGFKAGQRLRRHEAGGEDFWSWSRIFIKETYSERIIKEFL
jgi:hypothetical protein